MAWRYFLIYQGASQTVLRDHGILLEESVQLGQSGWVKALLEASRSYPMVTVATRTVLAVLCGSSDTGTRINVLHQPWVIASFCPVWFLLFNFVWVYIQPAWRQSWLDLGTIWSAGDQTWVGCVQRPFSLYLYSPTQCCMLLLNKSPN